MIIGCVIFFEDGPVLLEECLLSLSEIADKIIAIDGAYAEFPADKKRTSSDGCLAIAETYADQVITAPGDAGWADQVEKRNAYIKAAEAMGKEGDYLLILDADEIINGKKPTRLKENFYALRYSVEGVGAPGTICRLYRLRPGMRYVGKHNTIALPGSFFMNLGEPQGLPVAQGAEIVHRPARRPAIRNLLDGQYMEARKENQNPAPARGPQVANEAPATDKAPEERVVLEALHAYDGYALDGEHLALAVGSVVAVPAGTAQRLLTDFPKWFKGVK